MPIHFFEINQLLPLLISSLILITSLILFRNKSKLSILFLFFGILGLGYFMANLDPFLILWDEQFHALVAKNLSINPLEPKLYSQPVLPYSYENWTSNHIWLHKQPLFLWQMALSIKLFGINELAVRIPSILMHAVISLFIYRIGSIAINKRAAYFGALFFGVAFFPLELIAGRFSTDHNDIAFLFYVMGSFWSWFEYKKSNKFYWLVLVGLFAGGAVLNKWLMGLLIFIVWLVSKLFVESKERLNIKSYLPILYAGIISLTVFIPWQIYILLKFPEESKYELTLNSKHLYEPIEGHSADLWFYFTDGFRSLYGSGILLPFILLFGVLFLMYRIQNRSYRIGLIVAIVIVYSVFTFAATKMVAFTLLVSPFVYLGLGVMLDYLLSISSKKINLPLLTSSLSIILPLLIAYSALNLKRIQNNHTMWKPHDNHGRVMELEEMKLIHSISQMGLDKNYVIFNSNISPFGNIPLMFYTDYIAYSYIPKPNQISAIKKLGKKVAVIDLGNLPNYILNDTEIQIIEIPF